MAPTAALKTVGGDSNVQTYSSASITLQAGHLYLALLAQRNSGATPEEATLGTTGTWDLIVESELIIGTGRRVTVHRCAPASDVTGVVTIEGLTIDAHVELGIVDVTAFLAGGTNGSAAIGGVKVDNFDAGDTVFAFDLDDAPAASSMVLGFVGHNSPGLDVTAGSGFTELFDDGTAGEVGIFGEYDATTPDTTIDFSWSPSDVSGMVVAVEVLAAVASDDHTGAGKVPLGFYVSAAGGILQTGAGVAQLGFALGIFAEGSAGAAGENHDGAAKVSLGLWARGQGSSAIGEGTGGESDVDPDPDVPPPDPPPETLVRFWLEDLPSGQIRTMDFPLEDWSYEIILGRPMSLQGSLPKTSTFATLELLEPWKTAIYVIRGSKVEFGGILEPAELSVGETNLSLTSFGWTGYWDHRTIRKPYAPAGVDQFEIFRTLVLDAQDESYFPVGYDLGIDVTWTALSGVLRDRLVEYSLDKAKNLGEALRELAALEDGFDFSMDLTLNFVTNRIDKAIRLTYPRQGRETDFVFEVDHAADAPATNVTGYGFSDPVAFAWTGDGWGAGSDAQRLRSPYIDEELLGIYPPYDAAPAWSSVTDQGTLDDNTAAAFSRTNRPRRLPVIAVDPAKYPRWGDYKEGDVVTVRVSNGIGATGPAGTRVRIIGVRVAAGGVFELTLDSVFPT